MIEERTIEYTLSQLESGKQDYDLEIAALAREQPYVVAYLTGESNEAFTESELQTLLFGTLVIYHSIKAQRQPPAVATAATIEKAEDENYQTMEGAKGSFRQKLDPFFAATKQEDLLAFIEDLLSADPEEDTISKEAREPLFIALKTVVDVLVA